MESSFDRTGGNSDWAVLKANDQRGDPILVEITGPGIVRRLWMTGIPDTQELNFYFDGEKNPRIKATMEEFFGKKAPFLPPLCDHVSGGYYCYLPLPFKKSLRITLTKTKDKAERPYYQINYELFPVDTVLKSFPESIDSKLAGVISRVRNAWSGNAGAIRQSASHCKPGFCGEIKSGADSALLTHHGEGVLSTLFLNIHPPQTLSALSQSRLLRELVLLIYWDGLNTPSVCVPLGDFFCNPLRRWEFTSLPLAVTPEGLICRFPMYFNKSAKVVLRNNSKYSVQIDSAFDVQPVGVLAPRNYFHTAWNSSISPNAPHKILTATGKGHYVGCNLLAIGMDGAWNILEGDDQCYLDGEVFPSVHGTGLEDYFNGGWYYYGLFSLPLHGLIEKAPIRTTQYRFHMVDAYSFDKSILVNIEFGHGNTSKGYMSSTAYWYQDKPCGVRESWSPSPAEIPPDPMEPTAIMSALFELERSAKYDAAERRCFEHIEKYPQFPFNEMLKLRAFAYRERLQGVESVIAQYRQIVAESTSDAVKQQAGDLLWIHEKPENALLITSFNGASKVFLDGQLVAGGDDPLNIGIKRINVLPGKHVLTADYTRLRSYAWFSVQLRNSKQVLNTDNSWFVSDTKPDKWPVVEESTNGWRSALVQFGCPPFMSYWQFYPNAIVGCQAVNFITMPGEWSKDGKQVYFRKIFTIE